MDESARNLAALREEFAEMVRVTQAAREQAATRELAETLYADLVIDAGGRHGVDDARAAELADLAIRCAEVFETRWSRRQARVASDRLDKDAPE